MVKLSLYFVLLVTLITGFTRTIYAQAEVDERAMIRFDRGLGFHAPDIYGKVHLKAGSFIFRLNWESN